MDRRIGLIDRLNRAIVDSRHAGYVTHPMRDLLTQRVFQIVSGHEDGNDANTLRRDPLFKLAAGRAPLDDDNMLACGATFSRLEGALSRKDITAWPASWPSSSSQATPDTITLDMGAHR